MGILDGLKAIFSPSSPPRDMSQWLYVRCRRCGEAIRTRLDLRNDLSLRDEGGYIACKTITGRGRCFQRIEVTILFDEDRQMVSQEASGGEIITAEEYELAIQAAAEALARQETEDTAPDS